MYRFEWQWGTGDPDACTLEAAGYSRVINILHGFEGDLNADGHRSSVNGWRFDGLPGVQT